MKALGIIIICLALINSYAYAGSITGGGSGSATGGGSGYTVTAYTLSGETVTLEWDPPIGNPDIDGYRLYQSFNGGEFTLVKTVSTTTTTVDITTGKYVFYVTAYDGSVESDPSKIVIGVVQD